jgi:CrcB protein
MFQKVLWLSVAGACGTVSRFAVYELAAKAKNAHFALGTFTVNIIGSFLFGLIYVLAQRRMGINQEMRVILLTGFMGAFTTFSTFAFDTARLFKSAQYMMAFGNMFGQTALGVAALGAGVLIGRML